MTPVRENAAQEMKRMLRIPFPGEEEWLDAVTRLYAVVLVVGHDGQYFRAYTQDKSRFAVLEPALLEAVEEVTESAWFQANQSRLIWSEEWDKCLILPK